MANFFDQFDPPQQQSGNFFDQFDTPASADGRAPEYVQPAPPPGAIIHSGGDKDSPSISSVVLDNGKQLPMTRHADGQAGISTPEQERRSAAEMEALRVRGNRENIAPDEHNRGMLPVVQGATFGFGDEAFSAGRAARAALEGGSFGDTYSVNQQIERQDLDRERKEHFWRSLGSELGAGVAAPVGAIGGALKQGATGLQALAHGARAGAIGGGIYGAGTAEEGLEDRVTGGATGAVIGAAIGAPLGVAGNAIAGRAAPNAVAEAADRLGVQVPKAVATESRALQQIAAAESKMPFSGPMLAKAAEKTTQQIGDAADRVAAEYGATSAAGAGSAIREGIEAGWGGRAKENLAKLYGQVDSLVDPNAAATLNRTRDVVADIVAERTAQRVGDAGKAVNFVLDAVKDPKGLTYQGVKGLRERIGEMLPNQNALASMGISHRELSRIYGSLSDDLRQVVGQSGGARAVQAFERANSYARNVAGAREQLQKLTKATSDEEILQRLQSAASSKGSANISLLGRARKASGPAAWDEMSGTLFSRLGRDAESNFSPARFITDWGRLSEPAKKILFNSTDRGDLAKSIDDIATISSRFKQLQQFANPSGTAQSVLTASGIGAIGKAVVGIEPVTTFALLAGNAGLAKALSTPATAKSMARWSKFMETAVRKPSRGTIGMAQWASRRFAGDIGKNLGIELDPTQLYQAVIGRAPSYADQEHDR